LIPEGICILKLPSSEVVVPVVDPFGVTDTPLKELPLAAFVTLPVISFPWENDRNEKDKKRKKRLIAGIGLLIFISNRIRSLANQFSKTNVFSIHNVRLIYQIQKKYFTIFSIFQPSVNVCITIGSEMK
jgi:hypothetical protein